MYQHWLVSLAIASAPFVAVSPQGAPATQKPTTSTQKPAAPDTAKPAGQAASKGVRTIEIIATEDMKYSVPTIAAKPGEQLRVRLVAKGAMPKVAMAHNFVLLTKAANAVNFVTAAVMASASGYLPPDMKDQVLAATTMAGAGETVEVAFKAPSAAGDYTYLCSFPGHFQAGMKGTLSVK
jgi:azurin